MKQQTVRVNDSSEGDEYLVVRLEHVEPPINVINIYGMQEGKEGEEGRQKVLDSWSRLQKELMLIESRNEAVLLMGDYNRALGADEWGVPGNKERTSYGGEMIRDLLKDGEYVLLNGLDLAVGGPWTRVDPANGGLSCLDLALASACLMPYLTAFIVDSSRSFTPRRAEYRRGVFGYTYTDHYSLEAEFLMPSSKQRGQTKPTWNVFKPGAFENYEKVSKKYSKKVEEIVEDEDLDIEEVIKNFDKIQDKIKYEAFGKTKVKQRIKPKDESINIESEEEGAKRLSKKEMAKLEEHINKIVTGSNNRCGNVFKMKNMVEGSKKSGQEAQAIKDPKTGDLVVASSEIKKVTLEYCLEVLSNNEPNEENKDAVDLKEELIQEIMENKDGKFHVTEEAFERVMDNLEKKNKRSYDFVVKSSSEFKRAIFKLCKRISCSENIPSRFFLTILIQLYKGKGCLQQLTNSRYLHIKDYLPRVFEALVVDDMKDDIVAASSKFQIGGKPGMRTMFHLFVFKSIMANCENSTNGKIFTVADLIKFFDKERLIDAVLSLRGSVDAKALRLWWLLNSRTVIRVRTGAGETEEGDAGPVLAQGSSGGSLASMRNIDEAVMDYFETSEEEDVYGAVRLQPAIFMDDILRSASGVEDTNAGNLRMCRMTQELCLEIHPTKSCYLVMGSPEYKDAIEREVQKTPIMFGEVALKRESCVTYLGDELHEGGLEASVEATIQARQGKVRGSIQALCALWGDYRMQVVGGAVGAIKVFEACIVSSLLNNAGTWIGITEKQEKQLDSFQNEFVRALLRLPASTPLPCLRGATALMGMKWRVWREKLNLVLSIRRQEEGVLACQLFEEQVSLGLPGLVPEVRDICQSIGLPDITRGRPDNVSNKKVEEHIFYTHLKCLKEELKEKAPHKGKELLRLDISKPQGYLLCSSLAEARMAFRVQNRMLDIPGDMRKRYTGRMGCSACLAWRQGEGGEETKDAPILTREHLEVCEGYAFLRTGRDLIVETDMTRFAMDVMRLRTKATV